MSASQSDPIWLGGRLKQNQIKAGTPSEGTPYYVFVRKKPKMLTWEGCGEQTSEL